MAGNAARGRWTLSLTSEWIQRQRRKKAPAQSGRILKPPPKARGNGPRLCAEHQPQRHGEATRFGIIQRLCASALAAAGPSDTAAVRWWFQDAPAQSSKLRRMANSKSQFPALPGYLLKC